MLIFNVFDGLKPILRLRYFHYQRKIKTQPFILLIQNAGCFFMLRLIKIR
ncbi:hypothetical protein HMPREF0476_0899 [Kingella kingae ATCC 23330]|uniref:Uncharacterized protein n=1 Tax=Kingella kingae ATCC 23330 TaxID=887327 RepID=F5S6R6_KINKI|nr:hypothetical protein HMPREF0476_0899 [Kingella kingae ATCC 23330]